MSANTPHGPGWRFFHCTDCEHRWKEPCRDHTSPSSEACPKCGEACVSYYSEPDPLLPVDKWGNLIKE